VTFPESVQTPLDTLLLAFVFNWTIFPLRSSVSQAVMGNCKISD